MIGSNRAVRPDSPITPGLQRGLMLFRLLTLCSAAFLFSSSPILATENASGKDSSLVKTQAGISDSVQKLANGIDSFFGNDRYHTWETNKTSIRLRLNFDFIEGQDIDLNPQIKFNIFLPSISHRISLVANPESDEGSESGGDAVDDESELALRFTGGNIGKIQNAWDLGLRIKDSDLAVFLRLNSQRNFSMGQSRWDSRITNQIYWYTDTGFRDDFRFYLERSIKKNLFFRSRTRAQYFEEHGSNIFPEQRLTLFQRFGKKQILAYEGIAEIIPDDDTAFDDDNIDVVDTKYTNYLLRLRYRTNWLHPWLFVEFWPTIVWPEEKDYKTTYAARLRLEIHFGYTRPEKISIEE